MIVEYSVVDENGKLIRAGTCSEDLFEMQSLHAGEFVIPGIMEPEEVVVELTYREQRRRLYPPLEEFVDASYHALKGDSSRLEAYWEKVELIKQQIPKTP